MGYKLFLLISCFSSFYIIANNGAKIGTTTTTTAKPAPTTPPSRGRTPRLQPERPMANRYVNVANVNDRKKKNDRPILDDNFGDRFKQPFSPMFMDYCDPHHCNGEGKSRCGLNRNTMRFKWFRNACSLSQNNICAKYLGEMKYDSVNIKFCLQYVVFGRTYVPSNECPMEEDCDENINAKICGKNTYNGDLMIFLNKCYFRAYNCKLENFEAYIEVDWDECEPIVPSLNHHHPEIEALLNNEYEIIYLK
ncbi:uncharacterized protein LOC113234559 [Hyposmocoma kahamanoa]|uniref:uncharacterized protein LOC113234559 n=1 Tax=Hyposmocoma kahamanoa TaxID=1477025 RepID=UPI000E6D8E11|nr:uncharacterized protein LOC113234559 [Hyposmocoma kahamanoa]